MTFAGRWQTRTKVDASKDTVDRPTIYFVPDKIHRQYGVKLLCVLLSELPSLRGLNTTTTKETASMNKYIVKTARSSRLRN